MKCEFQRFKSPLSQGFFLQIPTPFISNNLNIGQITFKRPLDFKFMCYMLKMNKKLNLI